MNQMSKIQTNEAAKSKYERLLKRSTSTAVLVLFAQGLSGCFRNDGSIDGPSISGVAFDGPLSRAKVFVDANNNNLLDGSEDWTWTNSDGSFTLSTNATGPLVVVGTSETTDASSGASVDGLILTAPTGSSVISPATTVAKKLADDAIDALGANPTEEDIQTAIDNAYNQAAEAFGLSEAFTGAEASESLATFNPFSGDTSSADAVAYAQAAAKVVAAANSVATAVSAAGGADKGDALLSALNNIADQAAAADGELNIDVGAIVTAVDTTNVVTEGLSTSISNAVAKISTAIDSVTDANSDSAGDVLFVTQSILAESVETAAKGGSAATLELLANSADVAALASTFIKISGDNVAELSEDNELGEAEAHTLTGTLSIADPDDTDEVTYKFDAASENITYLGSGDPKGSLTITPEGEWTYTVSAETLAALNSLQALENKGTVNATDGAYKDSNFGVREAFQVLVTDGNGDPVLISGTDIQVSKIITVKIIGENDAPTLSDDFQTPSDVTVAQGENTTIEFDGAFEDVDTAEVLKFSAEGLPDGVSIDEDTGVISGKPSSTAFGEYSVTVSVTDAGGEKVSAPSLKISVTNTNDSPAVVSDDSASIAATEDAALLYDASALFSDADIANGHDETDTLTYTLESQVPIEWLSIDASTGALSGTPDNNDVTSEAFIITVTATDKYGLSAEKEISVTVGNTNDAPNAAIADLGVLRDTATKTLSIEDFASSVTDVDVGDEKILTSVSVQEGTGAIVDNGDNTFTYTPVDGEENTTVTFAYTVSDTEGAKSSSTADLLVVDAIPVGTGNEDGGAITLAASGYEDATFAVATSEVDGLASKGTFENGVFTPNADWFGSVAFDITTSAGVLPGILIVSSVNDAPVINAEATDTSLVVLDDGGSVEGTITASDIETTDLTYTVSGATKGSVTFTEDGNYTYTATAGEEGADSFTITVSDGTTTDDQTQVVTVQIGAVSVGSGREDSGAITIAAEGYQDATITLKEGEDISGKGTLVDDVFTPAENWFGSINFDIETTDGQTLPGVLVVSSVNDAPVIGDSNTTLTTDEDTAVSGTINVTDVDTDSADLTYSASGAEFGTVAFTSGGAFTYTPNANANGTDEFTVTVSDGDKTDTVTVNVTIDAVDDAPTLSVAYAGGSDVGIMEGADSANSIVLNASAEDIDSESIVFSLSGTDADSFTISSQGVVTLNEAADYETQPIYSFNVVATADGKEATELVTLNVIDVVEPTVLNAELSSSGDDHTVVLSLDATALANSEFVSIEGFSLAFSASGSPSDIAGIIKSGLNYARFDDGSTNRDAIANDWGVSQYTTSGAFRSDIFGEDETWALSGGDAVALATQDSAYEVVIEGETYDITSYIGTSFEIGTLTFSTSSDVTDLDIVVTGSVSGNNADGSLNATTGLLSEALTPITIDVI